MIESFALHLQTTNKNKFYIIFNNFNKFRNIITDSDNLLEWLKEK